jgi:subtilisin family serine protease
LRFCAQNSRIGLIDTFIDRDHPAFSGRNIEMRTFLPDGATRILNGHGTGVLSVLAGNPNSGTPGLVPDAHFFAADVYHADEGGQPISDTASLLRAIDWMRASQVGVINMSMTGPDDALLQKAIAEMSASGVLFVAAAGNGGPNAAPSYPAAYDHVIAVTAVDKDLRGYIYANHGDYIDVAAPGVGIWTAIPGMLEGYQSGTSFAAPHVTAILAAIRGRINDKSKDEVLKAVEIRDLGQVGRDRIYGRGLAMAPKGCPLRDDPSGWITDVVHTPVVPSAPIPSALTSSFR